MGTRWTPEEDQILRDTRETMKPKELAVLLNRSIGSVRNRIDHLRLPRVWNYKYYTNHDYFEHLTDESAYWLGFIFADGCVRPELNMMVLQVAIKDEEHLKLFHSKIGGSLRHDASRPDAVTLNVVSKKLIKDLIAHGCCAAKSLILDFPKLPEEVIPHFIRGYLDGDGCIFNYDEHLKRGKPKIAFNVLGTKSFLENLNSYLPFPCKVHLKHKTRIYTTMHYSKKAETNLAWIHQNSKLCLDRKWSKLTALSLQD